jgi:dihydrofolate synthase / folylpolyglutamate synthase
VSNIQNFEEVNQVLSQFIPEPGTAAAVYSLERIAALMEKLGNPQDSYKAIHVAGTSGKTSTCYYMASLLKAAGQKVGLTVSPHIEEVNERIQINLTPLPEAEFCSVFNEFLEAVNKTGIEPTYFELVIAMAYWEFARQKVNYAVIEVGLGGLLDATNVIKRSDKVCIITDIGLDHTHILGNSLSEIATQKAGIIQSSNHVFMYKQSKEVMRPISERVNQQQGVLTAGIIHPLSSDQDSSPLPVFQQRNFGLAKMAYDYVAARDRLPNLTQAGIQKAKMVTVPGRIEIFHVKGKTIILDGAHNTQKIAALVDSIRKLIGNQRIAVLLGVVHRPDFRTRIDLGPLVAISSSVIATEYGSVQEEGKQSVPAKELAEHCKRIGFQNIQTSTNPQDGFQLLLDQPNPIVLVTGSLYLMGYVRPLILGQA